MNPFKKKDKKAESNNLQEMQQQLNQQVYRLGALNYQKSIVKYQLSQLENEIADVIKKTDKLDQDITAVRNRIQAEMKAKIDEGKKDEKAPEGA